jgi:Head domain of trimeric autotransporter adhesin
LSNKTFIASTNNGGVLTNVTITNAAGISGVVVALTNGAWTNPSLTNGQNLGNPFRSPGTGTGSEQFGLGASATANGAAAFGDGAVASGVDSSAFGNGSTASANATVAVGQGSTADQAGAVGIGEDSDADGTGSIAIGFQAETVGDSSSAFGAISSAGFLSSTAIGTQATTVAAHQIMLGTSSEYVEIPGGAHIGGNVTNLQTTGTNKIAGIVTLPSFAVTLVNGNNTLDPGTNSFVIITGPTAGFTLASIKGGSNGRWLWVENATAQVMTSANNSGFDGVAANHIFNTPTGAGPDTNLTNGTGTYIYDSTQSRWILFGKN